MSILPRSIRSLIEHLSKLPGIGPKSASRLAFFLLKTRDTDRELLGEAVKNLKANLQYCQQCHNLAESVLCAICADKSRDQRLVCVVEEPLDVMALEQGGRYQGTYHVLGGVISPIDGIGPEDLKIQELTERIKGLHGSTSPISERSAGTPRPGEVKDTGGVEIIIATNPSLEGEGTAMFLAKELKALPDVKLTRIAHGLPIGGDIEYADELTISKAMEGRREYGS